MDMWSADVEFALYRNPGVRYFNHRENWTKGSLIDHNYKAKQTHEGLRDMFIKVALEMYE